MPISTKIVRVPVQYIDGEWELLYGGPIKVKDGTLCELHVHKNRVADAAWLKALTRKRVVRILPERTELRVALTIREPLSDELTKKLIRPVSVQPSISASISVDSAFVAIHLAEPNEKQRRREEKEGGLWLQLEGLEPRGLESGAVDLPKVEGLDKADSLNHAFTLLSEKFEPWRKAHTGSIYERVFYLETDERWHPLKDLRERELAKSEHGVIQALWEQVARELKTDCL